MKLENIKSLFEGKITFEYHVRLNSHNGFSVIKIELLLKNIVLI